MARLLALGRKPDGLQYHSAGPEYTSLMICFLLHNLSAADALLRLAKSCGSEWFPATVGYAIARTMFETDVTAHYITQSPVERSRQYIAFGSVLTKREMEACRKHCHSSAPSWHEAMNLVWENHWSQRTDEFDFGNAFKHAASFLTCFLELFATQFGTWVQKDVQNCWDIDGDNNRTQPTE